MVLVVAAWLVQEKTNAIQPAHRCHKIAIHSVYVRLSTQWSGGALLEGILTRMSPSSAPSRTQCDFHLPLSVIFIFHILSIFEPDWLNVAVLCYCSITQNECYPCDNT